MQLIRGVQFQGNVGPLIYYTHTQNGSTCVVALSDYTLVVLWLLLSNPGAFARACRFVCSGWAGIYQLTVMFKEPDRKLDQPPVLLG